jgi:hypothetical protein
LWLLETERKKSIGEERALAAEAADAAEVGNGKAVLLCFLFLFGTVDRCPPR